MRRQAAVRLTETAMALNSKSRAVIRDIVIVGLGVLVIWLALSLVFGTQNPFYVVSSGSMIPALQVYDVIVVQGNDPFEEVEVGDIIVFNRPSGHDRVIVHRVVAITSDDPYTVKTQGDANPMAIHGTDFPITAEEYIGTVAHVVPQVGYITRIFATDVGGIPLNYIIIAVIIGIMVVKQMTRPKDGGGDDDGGGGDKKGTDMGGGDDGGRSEDGEAGRGAEDAGGDNDPQRRLEQGAGRGVEHSSSSPAPSSTTTTTAPS